MLKLPPQALPLCGPCFASFRKHISVLSATRTARTPAVCKVCAVDTLLKHIAVCQSESNTFFKRMVGHYDCKAEVIISIQVEVFRYSFSRPYRYFLIVWKVSFSLSDRYKIFTSDWRWIEICENVVLSEIDITMTTINKQNGNW